MRACKTINFMTTVHCFTDTTSHLLSSTFKICISLMFVVMLEVLAMTYCCWHSRSSLMLEARMVMAQLPVSALPLQ